MKYIKNIESVTLKNLNDEELLDEKKNPVKLSLKDFILQRLSDVAFSKDMEGVLSAMQIQQALKESEGEEYIPLETKDWEKLSGLVKNPSNPYNPNCSISLIGLMKAITEATDEKPGFVKTGD